MTMHAYCYASGQIGFGPRTPNGALTICKGPAKAVRELIEVTARHGYQIRNRDDGGIEIIPGTECLLVPGIPECRGNQELAGDALEAYLIWITGRGLPKGITTDRSPTYARRKLRDPKWIAQQHARDEQCMRAVLAGATP